MANDMEWLRLHMRRHMARSASREVSEKVPRRRISHGPTTENAQRASSLSTGAADVISCIEDRTRALQARCEAVLASVTEKLEATEERINLLQSEQKTATTRIRETELNVEEMQSAVDAADSRRKCAGRRLWQAESYARTTAGRGEEAEKALVPIEEAIGSFIAKRFALRTRITAAERSRLS